MFLTGFRSFSRKHGRISNGTISLKRVCATLPIKFSRVYSRYSFQNLANTIVTLDPKKLAEKKQQCLHIGGRTAFRPAPLDRSNAALYYESGKDGSPHALYPPNTKGFLYYSISPGRPRIAGELRFRVTSTDDHTSFESGSDLLRRNGLPWSRPLYVLSKVVLPLYENLKEEGFVPDDFDKVLQTFPSVRLQYRKSQVLYTLNDTFIIGFSQGKFKLFVITEQGVNTLVSERKFVDFVE
jgi:hypothetical protein